MSDDDFIIDDVYLPRAPLETQHVKIIPLADYDALIHERDSLRAALESLTSAWFAGVSGSPDRTEVSRYCVYCSGYMSFASAVNTNETPFAHKPDCPIVRARKLLEMSNE